MTKTVLHVGSGPGSILTQKPFDDGGWKEIRLDVDESVKPDVVASMLDMSPVESGSVDAVVCSHCLEHLDEKDVVPALKECLRVMKAQAFAMFVVPDLLQVAKKVASGEVALDGELYEVSAGKFTPLDVIFGWSKMVEGGHDSMRHKTGFTRDKLRDAFDAAGFCEMNISEGEFELAMLAKKPGRPNLGSVGDGLFEHKILVGICTPIPAVDGPHGKHLAPVTTEWHRARKSLVNPFGYNTVDIHADGMEVGEARCHVARQCLDHGIDYLFFLDWDVLCAPDALHRLMYQLQNHPEVDVVNGVYCAKSQPPSPLVYREYGEGVHWDWTVGDLLTGMAGAGMGCTLIRTSIFKRLPHTPERPWFKTLKEFDEKNAAEVCITEDSWFYRRAVTEANANIAIDTGVLCAHIDPKTGAQYILPDDSLPMRRLKAKQEAANA